MRARRSKQRSGGSRMCCGMLKFVSRVISISFLILAPVTLMAQASPAVIGNNHRSNQYASKWDIFAGYSYLAPKGTVDVPQRNGTVLPFSYDPVNVGGLFSGAYYFNRHLGAQIEFAEHQWGTQNDPTSNVGSQGNNDGFNTLGAGIIFRIPNGNITPFLHGLIDAEQ